MLPVRRARRYPPALRGYCARTATDDTPDTIGKARKPCGFRAFLQLWWPGSESNQRHADFQSAALPTELPGHEEQKYNKGDCVAQVLLTTISHYTLR